MEIFGVHPADKNLNFLSKVNTDLADKYLYTYLYLEANHHTHEKCINALQKSSSGLLFFFCHSLDKTIRGCKIENAASSKSHKDFNYGPLISPSKNIEIFKGKKVFCLACFSKDLGPDAISAGAKVYIGFGDIPFYLTDNFKEERVEAEVKTKLAKIIYQSLCIAIDENYSFNKLSTTLQLIINKERFNLLSDTSPGRKFRVEIAKVLSRIKNGITMYGDGNLKLMD